MSDYNPEKKPSHLRLVRNEPEAPAEEGKLTPPFETEQTDETLKHHHQNDHVDASKKKPRPQPKKGSATDA